MVISVLLIATSTMRTQEVLTLQQCMTLALENHETVQIGGNAVKISESRAAEARSGYIPKVTVNADYKYFLELPHQLMPLSTFNPMAQEGQFKEAQFGVPHNANASITASMVLYSPQIGGAISGASTATELARLQKTQSEDALRYSVALAYYQAQLLEHQRDFASGNLENSRRLLASTQLLYQQLMVKKTDVSRVELQIEQIESRIEFLRSSYEQVMLTLKMLMGAEPNSQISVAPLAIPDGPEASAPRYIDQEVLQGQKKLLENEINWLQKSRYLPTISVVAQYGLNGFGYDKAPNEFIKTYPVGFVGLQLTYPVFNGTATVEKIQQKELELSNNLLQQQLVTHKTVVETQNAINRLELSKQTLHTTRHQVEFADEIYRQVVLQQKEGTASLADVLLTDGALREAQQGYITASTEFLKARLELLRLNGLLSSL